jgi:hypothetical protein
MIQLVEEMGARISQITDAEQELVRALGDALSRVDQKLLQDVRKITNEHESRRGAILHELQGLATRIGAFPAPREPIQSVEYSEPAARPLTAASGIPPAHDTPAAGGAPSYSAVPTVNGLSAANGVAAANGSHRPFSRGDWRQAASNIEDELDSFFKERAAASH